MNMYIVCIALAGMHIRTSDRTTILHGPNEPKETKDQTHQRPDCADTRYASCSERCPIPHNASDAMSLSAIKQTSNTIASLFAQEPRATESDNVPLRVPPKLPFALKNDYTVHGTLAYLHEHHPNGYSQSPEELYGVRFFGYMIPIQPDDTAFKYAGMISQERSGRFVNNHSVRRDTGVFYFVGYKMEGGVAKKLVFSACTKDEIEAPGFLIPSFPSEFTYNGSDTCCTLATHKIELVNPYLGARVGIGNPRPQKLPEFQETQPAPSAKKQKLGNVDAPLVRTLDRENTLLVSVYTRKSPVAQM